MKCSFEVDAFDSYSQLSEAQRATGASQIDAALEGRPVSEGFLANLGARLAASDGALGIAVESLVDGPGCNTRFEFMPIAKAVDLLLSKDDPQIAIVARKLAAVNAEREQLADLKRMHIQADERAQRQRREDRWFDLWSALPRDRRAMLRLSATSPGAGMDALPRALSAEAHEPSRTDVKLIDRIPVSALEV